ncbi:MAG: hypothetical protein HLUCCA11_01480 [Phormidesmis priestleyi Ana]|uniref:Uncharacterized protein n=1 Tax=Phormidesmis priestleyi Ana TaxID=1666911 RepID=A0A0P8BUJ2_9CYAN|nr:MAG: hypothetical protein HLUCCA11_01480 [Phormidesmis priestleyi Ana]
MAVGGLGVTSGLSSQQATAQTVPNISRDANTGAVELEINAFSIRTGEFNNTSNIPLPSSLLQNISENRAQPTTSTILAPNNIELSVDTEYINESLRSVLTQQTGDTNYQLQPDSLRVQTEFNLRRSEGKHAFGEGIEATVFAPDGSVISQERVFVRGDDVQIGPDGNVLPEEQQITVSYGTQDRVELRVLNIRENNAEPSESGIYFLTDGSLAVEDLPNGGDLDFNDGDYVQVSGGTGEAAVLSETEEVSVETVNNDVPLDPEQRQEEVVETDIARGLISTDRTSQEERDWGRVETADSISTIRLGHATGTQTESGEQLVYNRYAAAREVRLGSDGLGVTGQLSPLIQNPNIPPTLLTGNLTFNPTVGNNEAGLTTTVGVTQFLNPTHQVARDIFGNEIAAPDGAGLVEPVGMFSDRQWIGYVPAQPDQTLRGDQLFSVNGIFELPEDKGIEIAPPDPNSVGRGRAAYTRNVGGLLIEFAAGDMTFVPQWTETGYAQESLTLAAGEARRVIYALVPQQPNQALQLGDRYAVTDTANGYRIVDGGFTIISADRQPQNFQIEQSDVYAVEDTLPGSNMVTDIFNGVRGVYIEVPGGEPVPTVDVSLTDEVDARVGNALFPLEIIEGDDGQMGYAQTTRSAGFYLGSTATLGIGNQEDTVRQVETTIERATDAMIMTRTVTTFVTPLIARESLVNQVTRTTRSTGVAAFDISPQGELVDVQFIADGPSETTTQQTELDRTFDLIRGEEFRVLTETSESRQVISSQEIERDQTVTDITTDSYANFSSLQGELSLGSVLNWGNTPWTAAANTVKAELFARNTVIGRSTDGNETGWRAEVLFHPFGEVQREAHYYDAAGNALPLYQTEAVITANGQQQVETVTAANGETVAVPIYQFVIDEAGDRIAQTIGTGQTKGPGIYLRIEDVFNDNHSALLAGGIQLAF